MTHGERIGEKIEVRPGSAAYIRKPVDDRALLDAISLGVGCVNSKLAVSIGA